MIFLYIAVLTLLGLSPVEAALPAEQIQKLRDEAPVHFTMNIRNVAVTMKPEPNVTDAVCHVTGDIVSISGNDRFVKESSPLVFDIACVTENYLSAPGILSADADLLKKAHVMEVWGGTAEINGATVFDLYDFEIKN